MTLTALAPFPASLQCVWTMGGMQQLIEDTAANRTLMEVCCCETTCHCSTFCASPGFRVIYSGDDPLNPGNCITDEVIAGTFTEGDVGTIPGDQPCGGGTAGRYWTASIDGTCVDSGPILIELACCTIGGIGYLEMRGSDGTWCTLQGPDECVNYWASESEISILLGTDAACNTTPFIQIWCGDENDPGQPACGVTDATGTEAGGCN